MTIIADFATVSVPEGQGLHLRAALTDVCLQLPDAESNTSGVRVGSFGQLRFSSMHGVAVASASGEILTALRNASLLHDYASAIASTVTFKVTHLDLAHDEQADAPAYIAHKYALLRVGGVALSRKRISPDRIKLLCSRGDDGRDTGSIMLGDRNKARVTAIIYDRRHNALCRGKPNPGQLVRTELRLGVDGMTLRDLLVPAPLFYHYAAPGLFAKPADVPAWTPYGEGFAVSRHQRSIDDQLRALIDHSFDVCRILELAHQVDPANPLRYLALLLHARDDTRQRTLRLTTRATAARGSEPPLSTPSPTPAQRYDA